MQKNNAAGLCLITVLALTGCGTLKSMGAGGADGDRPPVSESKPVGKAEGKPAEKVQAAKVADSKAAQAGQPRKVKGRNGVDGEVTGTLAANSKFKKVEIGMGSREIIDLIGAPNDQWTYPSGKAFNPFYYGPDRVRTEYAYKGHGRLIFSGGVWGNALRLIAIVHNPADAGYR